MNGTQPGESNIYLSIAREGVKRGDSTPRSISKLSPRINTDIQVNPGQMEAKSSGNPKIEQSAASISDIQLRVNESFTKELETSLVLETINKETVESMSLIVEGLGFDNVSIRGISSKSFLVYFFSVENLDSLDLGFLEIGFTKVKKASSQDLISTRKSWIECRGYQLRCGRKAILKTFVRSWGL